MQTDDFVLIGGTANPRLAACVAAELGAPLAPCRVKRFPDGEVSVELEEPVRRREVVLLQPTAPPVDAHLMELAALADACRRGAANRVTAVVPYYGYSRSDRRGGQRTAITGSLVARLMQAAGIDHLVTVDLHAEQIEGFFSVPVDNLSAVSVLAADLADHLPPETLVVSPDAGRVGMAGAYAQRLGLSMAVLHKHRSSPSEAAITRVVGEVKGRPCLIVDDMISTGGTIAAAVSSLCQAGAKPPFTVAATHGLFVGPAFERLDRPEIKEIVVTDTVAVPDFALARAEGGCRVRVVSVAALLARAVERTLSDAWADDEL